MKTHNIMITAILISISIAGCNLGATPPAVDAPTVETSAGGESAETQTSPEVQNEAENVVAFDEMGIAVGFDYPDGFQQGADTSVQPVYENPGPTELPYPQHARILFTSYTFGSTDNTASGIRVFRVEEINALEAGIVENLFAVLDGQADHHTDFPRFSGAGALIDAQLVEVPFQNGRGYRYLYTSSFAAQMLNGTGVNLMYQGITADEKYFVSFLIPVDAPFLSEFVGAPMATTPEEFEAYYQTVNERINNAAPDEFNPSLAALDELIASIVVIEK